MADIIFTEDELCKIVSKDSFIIYKDRLPDDLQEALEEGDIELEDLGQIFLAIICDQTGQSVPEIKSRYARTIFKGIKKGYDQANRKWLAQCERNRSNGEKGGRPPKNPDKPSGIIDNTDKPNGFLKEPNGFPDKPSGFLKNPDEPTRTQTNPHEPDKRREEKKREEKAREEREKGRAQVLPTLADLTTFMTNHDITRPTPEVMLKGLEDRKTHPDSWESYILEIYGKQTQ